MLPRLRACQVQPHIFSASYDTLIRERAQTRSIVIHNVSTRTRGGNAAFKRPGAVFSFFFPSVKALPGQKYLWSSMIRSASLLLEVFGPGAAHFGPSQMMCRLSHVPSGNPLVVAFRNSVHFPFMSGQNTPCPCKNRCCFLSLRLRLFPWEWHYSMHN